MNEPPRQYAVMLRRKPGRHWFEDTETIDATIHPKTWLGRLAMKVLEKSGYRVTRPVRFEDSASYTTFDEDSLYRRIRLGSYELQLVWEKRATRILVGRDLIEKLYHEIDDLMPFEAQVRFSVANGGEQRICDMKVEFIPWMEGMVLVP